MYGFHAALDAEFSDAERFGVLVGIDTQGAMKEKIGADMRLYRILGETVASIDPATMVARTDDPQVREVADDSAARLRRGCAPRGRARLSARWCDRRSR